MIKRLSKTLCILMSVVVVATSTDFITADYVAAAENEDSALLGADSGTLEDIIGDDELDGLGEINGPMGDSDTNQVDNADTDSALEENKHEEEIEGEEAEETEEIEEEIEEETEEVESDEDILTEDEEIQEISASGKCGDNLTYTIEKLVGSPDYRLTISGTGDMKDYSLTTAANNLPPWYTFFRNARAQDIQLVIEEGVTSIGNSAFNGVAVSGGVNIPASLKRIGLSSFANNTKITGLNLASGSELETIDDYAFTGCSQLSSEIPMTDSLVKIGNGAFQNDKAMQGGFIAGDSLKQIGDKAFIGCVGLGGDFIPGSNIETIGDYAFSGCSALKSSGTLVLGGALTKIGTYAFKDCRGLKGNLMIDGSALVIGPYAFCNCSSFTDNLIIGDGVKMVGAGAFSGCVNIGGGSVGSDLVIGNGVETIGSKAFESCTRIKGALVVGSSLTTIAADAFASMSPRIIINNSDKVIKIPNKQFINCDTLETVSDIGFGKYYSTALSSYKSIRLDANGGVIGDGSTYEFPYVKKLEGIDGVDIKRSNCTFIGWYTEREGGTLMTNASEVPTGVSTLYAHWIINIVDAVSAPVATIDSGEVAKGTVIKLSTPTNGAKIYYTLDGSTPTVDGLLFDNVIRINANTTVKAIAVKECYSDSSVAVFTYTLKAEGYDEVDITDALEAGYTSPEMIPNRIWVAGLTEMPYTGAKITLPDLHVYYGKKLLNLNKDYVLAYSSNTDVGNAVIKITGRGNYDGTITRTFAITKADIETELVFNDIILSYDASKPLLQKGLPKEVFDKTGKAVTFRAGKDYTCEYPDTSSGAYINPGEYTVIVNGQGNYKGNITIKEVITDRINIASASVDKIKDAKHTGNPIKPAVNVKYKGAIVSAENYTVTYENNTNLGSATVTLTGKGRFIGKKTVYFNIVTTNLSETTYTGHVSSYPYTGYPILQSGYFYDAGQGKVLVCGSDYTAEYTDNVNPGQVTVIYRGINGYTGTKKVTYNITGVPFNKSKVSINIDIPKIKVVYSGKPVDLKEQGYLYELSYIESAGAVPVSLTEGVDYSVSYTNNSLAGKGAAIKFTGLGRYQGSFSESFIISKFDLTEKPEDTSVIKAKITADASYPYMKNGSEPVPVIQLVKGDTVLYNLRKDVDFTLKYYNNLNVDYKEVEKPVMVIQGKGNFTGKAARIFDMTPSDFSKVTITATDIPYQNKAGLCKPKVTVTDLNGRKLSAGSDYKSDFTYRYDENVIVRQLRSGGNAVSILRNKGDNVNAKDIIPARTMVRVGVTGLNNYAGSKSVLITYLPTDISKASVDVAEQYYTGSPVEPDKSDITVKVSGVELSKSEYDVISYANNTVQGTASLVIEGKGNYSGTKTVNFKILKRSMYYLVSFRANGGTGKMPTLSIVKDGVPLKANAYKREGNVFKEWNTHADGSGDSIANQAPLNLTAKEGTVVILYAQWKPGDYAITYDLMGGENDLSNPDSYTYGDSITFKEPTRTGYRFDGWHKDKETGALVKGISSTQTGNIKLVAKWKPISYYIVLDGNGGKTLSGLTSDESMATQVYGTAVSLKANPFTNSGKNFYRWSTNKDGSGQTFRNKESVKNLTITPWSKVTLYAQWVPNTLTDSVLPGDTFIVPSGSSFTLKISDSKPLCLYSYTITNKTTGRVVKKYELSNVMLKEINKSELISSLAKGEYEIRYSACEYVQTYVEVGSKGEKELRYIIDKEKMKNYKCNILVD